MSARGWRYDRWIGHFDGTMSMLIRHLFHWRGWQIDLHRMVNTDMPDCFHTYPAWAVRIVLRNGRDSVSLWIRAPKRHAIHLIGSGWEIERAKHGPRQGSA